MTNGHIKVSYQLPSTAAVDFSQISVCRMSDRNVVLFIHIMCLTVYEKQRKCSLMKRELLLCNINDVLSTESNQVMGKPKITLLSYAFCCILAELRNSFRLLPAFMYLPGRPLGRALAACLYPPALTPCDLNMCKATYTLLTLELIT